MFSTGDYTGGTRISPKFGAGWNKAKIESIEIKSASTGRKQLLFKVFGEPVSVEGFKPFKKGDGTLYHGQCGIVTTNYFMPEDANEIGKIMNRVINPIAIAFGVKEAVDGATKNVDSLEQFVSAYSAIVTNSDLPYVWMNFSGEEYEKPGSDFPGYKLSFKLVTNDEGVKNKVAAGVMKPLPKKDVSTTEEAVF